MLIKLRVLSFEDVFEDDGEHIGEREFILKHSQEQKSSIESDMNEKPECILIWKANNDQISNDEVDALSVPHRWKMIGDSLEHPRKINSLQWGKLESSI